MASFYFLINSIFFLHKLCVNISLYLNALTSSCSIILSRSSGTKVSFIYLFIAILGFFSPLYGQIILPSHIVNQSPWSLLNLTINCGFDSLPLNNSSKSLTTLFVKFPVPVSISLANAFLRLSS